MMSLPDKVVQLEAENARLREELDSYTRTEAIKYRRIDCLRLAVKKAEHGGDWDAIPNVALGYMAFVEQSTADPLLAKSTGPQVSA